MPPDVFIHPNALCESEHIGKGTRVWAFAHVMPQAVIGTDCNICDHAFIESGAVIGNRVTVKNNVLIWDKVVIEDDVFLGPNVVLTNDLRPRAAFKNPPSKFLPTKICTGASVGANATIVCGVTLGSWSMVGAGAVVTRDVQPYALVLGNPAKFAGWTCMCGETLNKQLNCTCGRGYRLISEKQIELLNDPPASKSAHITS
jgi:acetyltransferase-like isoleucine patch superfamily enzyme